ncbi:MAG: hypothetical protein HRU50_14665 [Winogradskyella sp.]|uniref:hypothetical protein n=1 Tax=Winogradskyella sp. TaxID=1883156 RepID=UPI0025F1310A|nr:hypothetical protein [Winogradskyella sp.]NRB61167.1 hypothetical protein [Winogradskyella sp.]
MDIGLLRLLIDFGLVVLIWIVQLIIYPSFTYYQNTSLLKWHRIYTGRVTIIVLPLMVSQLIISVIQVLNGLNLYTIASLFIIIILWLLTFLLFVPLHQKIDQNKFESSTTVRLVNLNWFRTALWSLLFFLSLLNYI